MRQIPKPYEIYRHFKGNLYQIVTIAEHSETGETLVVYQALYGDFQRYARPLSMFMEKTDRVKYPFATQEYRFELAEPGQQGTVEAVKAKERDGTFPEKEGCADAVEQTGNGEKADAVQESGIAAESVTAPESMEAGSTGTEGESIQEEAEKLNIDPMVLEFLDASSYDERLGILAALHHRITDDMINVMAMATDIEVGEGDVEERYAQLRNCLLKLERFECNRLR